MVNYYLETVEMYQDAMKHRFIQKDKWIYDILDGSQESEKIIYQDDFFILLPSTSKFHEKELHLLAILRNRSLKCLRSLNEDHISLLEHILHQTRRKIQNVDLLAEIHYLPSTFQLHIHFYTEKKANSINKYRRHALEKVIQNIQKSPFYYQHALVIGIHNQKIHNQK